MIDLMSFDENIPHTVEINGFTARTEVTVFILPFFRIYSVGSQNSTLLAITNYALRGDVWWPFSKNLFPKMSYISMSYICVRPCCLHLMRDQVNTAALSIVISVMVGYSDRKKIPMIHILNLLTLIFISYS